MVLRYYGESQVAFTLPALLITVHIGLLEMIHVYVSAHNLLCKKLLSSQVSKIFAYYPSAMKLGGASAVAGRHSLVLRPCEAYVQIRAMCKGLKA